MKASKKIFIFILESICSSFLLMSKLTLEDLRIVVTTLHFADFS
jgi:hypothetical protein